MDKIIVRHTYTSIPNYSLGDCEYLEKMLSIYNKTYYRLEPKAFIYIDGNNEMRIPSGIDPNYVARLLNRNIEIDYVPDPHASAIINLKCEPRSDLQKYGVAFLIGEGDFTNTKKYSQLSLSLETG